MTRICGGGAASGGELMDTRPFVLPASRTGIKFEDAFAAMAKRLGEALKAGRPLVLDCKDVSPHWLVKDDSPL